VAKDKKKKKDKKAPKAGVGGKAAKRLKLVSQNPLVADIVAAALVATASALKDSNKARRLASDAGDELAKLSKASAEKGNALWDMALQIGRRSLETLSADMKPKRTKPNAPKRAKSKAGTARKPAKKRAARSTSR
jgi:hypothetical protein